MDMSLSKFREIEKDRESWHDTYSPWGCKELDMTERLNNNNKCIGNARAFQDSLESFLWCVPLLSGPISWASHPESPQGTSGWLQCLMIQGWAWSFHPEFLQGSPSSGGEEGVDEGGYSGWWLQQPLFIDMVGSIFSSHPVGCEVTDRSQWLTTTSLQRNCLGVIQGYEKCTCLVPTPGI